MEFWLNVTEFIKYPTVKSPFGTREITPDLGLNTLVVVIDRKYL